MSKMTAAATAFQNLQERSRLAAALRTVIGQRRELKALFPPGIICDPCLNILLDIFACELDGVQVSVKSACVAAEVPTSTALRWIKTMCKRGLIVRSKDPRDRRRSFLRLSVDGRAVMLTYARLAGL